MSKQYCNNLYIQVSFYKIHCNNKEWSWSFQTLAIQITKRMEEWFCRLENLQLFLLTALKVFRWMSFIPGLWFALARIFPFFSTTALHNFFNPSLRNLVYPGCELLIYFPSFMYVTASSLQSPASNCCCSHRHLQDQALQ